MNKNNLKSAIIIGAITLLGTTTVFGQSDQRRPNQEPPSVDQIFEELDSDEDGLISKEEVKGPLKNDFAKIDTDEDGFISKKELEKAPKPQRRRKEQ